MTVDMIALALVIMMAPAVTLFPILYGLTRPWYRSLLGRALMASSTGLGLLVDISLLYKFFGDDYPGRDYVRLTVYFIIFLGAWFKLTALLTTYPWWPRRKGCDQRRMDHVDGPQDETQGLVGRDPATPDPRLSGAAPHAGRTE